MKKIVLLLSLLAGGLALPSHAAPLALSGAAYVQETTNGNPGGGGNEGLDSTPTDTLPPADRATAPSSNPATEPEATPGGPKYLPYILMAIIGIGLGIYMGRKRKK